MKLHWSPRSPFVRKVVMVLRETGLHTQVEYVCSVVAMAQPNADLMRDNPLSQIPALVLPNGEVLYDSAVICEYLDTLHGGAPLFPPLGAARWRALRRQALGDGMLAILLLWRQERMKSAAQQLPAWLCSFDSKISASLDWLEAEAATLDDGFDIGHITLGCMLSYLDYRFADVVHWRSGRPVLAGWHTRFCQRASARASVPDASAA